MKKVEIWKPVKNYELLYEISNFGNLRSLNRITKTSKGFRSYKGKKIKPVIDKKTNYGMYVLSKDGVRENYRIHVLVAICFLNHKKSKYQLVVDHIDGNALNNNLSNLQIISHRQNISKSKKSNSKYTGVCFHKTKQKYISSISYKNKLIHLGYFDNEIDAFNKRQEFIIKNNIYNAEMLLS
jgi:hypothetical protein